VSRERKIFAGFGELIAENLARQSRNQNSEYLPQRRKGRKEIELPNLAFLASWREQIPVLDSHVHLKICANYENFQAYEYIDLK